MGKISIFDCCIPKIDVAGAVKWAKSAFWAAVCPNLLFQAVLLGHIQRISRCMSKFLLSDAAFWTFSSLFLLYIQNNRRLPEYLKLKAPSQ